MKYEDYQVWDFLQDQFFVSWVREPTIESDAFWSEWIGAHPHRIATLEEAAQIIKTIRYADVEPLQQREKAEILETILRRRQTESHIHSKNRYIKLAVRIAASVVLGITAYLWIGPDSKIERDKEDKIEFITRSNPKGQKSLITLPDGTNVKLNAESSLTFNSNYGINNRIVSLNGEAFFDVKENPNMPFIIRTGKLQTKVLGTSFDVRSYESEENIQIVVVTGEVEVSDSLGTSVILNPKEVLEYSIYDGNIRRSICKDFKRAIGWKDGFLVFDNEPIDKVVDKIEGWYGVDVKFANGCHIAGFYTGEYHNKSLERVMDGISYASGFQYQIVNDTTVIISKKRP